MTTIETPQLVKAPVVSREAVLGLVADYADLDESQDYYLRIEDHPKAYRATAEILDEVVDLITELSPEYASTSRELALVKGAVEVAASGLSSFRLMAGRVFKKDEKSRNDIPPGSYSRIGDGIFDISLSPKKIKTYADNLGVYLNEYTDKPVGQEAGSLLVLTHELGHAVHDYYKLHDSLAANPGWALSDNIGRAIAIEWERFAVGLECIITARYIARNYGGDAAKIEEVLRFKLENDPTGRFAILDEGAFDADDTSGIKSTQDNSGYKTPLTSEQIKARLDFMARLESGEIPKNSKPWKGMDRSENGEWEKATRDAQLYAGLAGLKKRKEKQTEEKNKRKERHKFGKEVVVKAGTGVSLIMLGAVGFPKAVDQTREWIYGPGPVEVIQDPPQNQVTFRTAKGEGVIIPEGNRWIINGRVYAIEEGTGKLIDQGPLTVSPEESSVDTSDPED